MWYKNYYTWFLTWGLAAGAMNVPVVCYYFKLSSFDFICNFNFNLITNSLLLILKGFTLFNHWQNNKKETK